ncbi:hypothetical protein DMZ73_22605 [Salmonella enterica subsp. enterica serovar Inganda]|nr:hypothetical protein [Salmonella enterica subsp. enterica serovar Inganda]ECH8970750.1 hypothetical protein [Salmonella enterica subsp. enterica]EDU9603461.1 hypothetical protein [Salmonella enterica subsp. enterica]
MKYAYFKLDAVVTDKYVSMYNADVKPSREHILCRLQASLGAVGFKVIDGPFKVKINGVYFDTAPGCGWEAEDTDLLIGGKSLFLAVPDTSCVEGRLLQEEIRQAEERLRAYPSFENWIFNKLGIVGLAGVFWRASSAWVMAFSRKRDAILFRVSLREGVVCGKVPDECIRIKHFEYVALLEE